nr:MAG TPA: hypothetical protein [Caudoviricetes sp.]
MKIAYLFLHVIYTFILAQFSCNVNYYNKVSEKLCKYTKCCCNY